MSSVSCGMRVSCGAPSSSSRCLSSSRSHSLQSRRALSRVSSSSKVHAVRRERSVRVSAEAAALESPTGVAVTSEELSSSRLSAVVKLHVTSMCPDWKNPWQTKSASRSTGSGALIARRTRVSEESGEEETVNIILTAAHVVADVTYLQIQKGQSPDKYIAKASAVLHESDIALVEVVGNMFDDIEPLHIASADTLPSLRKKVWVLGFPVGGDEISITEGVISRVEVQNYSHSHSPALAVTVDAAVNAGNSGGPAVDTESGELIGIAFQGYSGSDIENQGHLVPTPLIHHFLEGLERGDPTLPTLGICMQRLQSGSIREKLEMAEGETGVMISKVSFNGAAYGALHVGDVLLSVAGISLANDGTIVFLDKRLSLVSLLHTFFVGDTVACRVKRGGEYLTIDVKLSKNSHLVPRSQYDTEPPYYLVGGLLFQPLSFDYIRCWSSLKDAPIHLMHEYLHGHSCEAYDEMVVLTQIFSDDINMGYTWDECALECVTSVNDQPIRNMNDLVRVVESVRKSSERWLEVMVASGASRESNGFPVKIVLDCNKLEEADKRLMRNYKIPSDRSHHFM